MYLIFIFLNLICCILFLQHDFDIEEIDTPHMWETILMHMGRLLKRFRYELHYYWKEPFGARGSGRHVRHPTGMFHALTGISSVTSMRTLYTGYNYYI